MIKKSGIIDIRGERFLRHLIKERPGQTMSWLRKSRCTFGLHVEANPRAGLGTGRVVPTGCGRECKGKILKNGKIKTWCLEKIPRGRVCYSVKTFPHAWRSRLPTEGLEADPRDSLLCPHLRPRLSPCLTPRLWPAWVARRTLSHPISVAVS